jgi:hypothetical protein
MMKKKVKLTKKRKCTRDFNLTKRTIIKKDGRYLIYYTFK